MPRFLYRGLQEGWTPQVEGPKLGTLRPGQVKEYLLCGECEGQFQQWEQAAGTFYHNICSLDAEESEADARAVGDLVQPRLVVPLLPAKRDNGVEWEEVGDEGV